MTFLEDLFHLFLIVLVLILFSALYCFFGLFLYWILNA